MNIPIEYREENWQWLEHSVSGAYYWQRGDGRWVGPYISEQAARMAAEVLLALRGECDGTLDAAEHRMVRPDLYE